jgi:hypothetical protein
MPLPKTTPAELVALLRATLVAGLDLNEATTVLNELDDKLLVPSGLSLDGGLAPRVGPKAPFEIVGVVIRSDGADLSERERKAVDAALRAFGKVAHFSLGPLRPADSPAVS